MAFPSTGPLPLYTFKDALRSLKQLEPVEFEQHLSVPGSASALLRSAGHIMRAASIELDWGGTKIVFSGDLGRYGEATMVEPVKSNMPTMLSLSRLTAIAGMTRGILKMHPLKSSVARSDEAER